MSDIVFNKTLGSVISTPGIGKVSVYFDSADQRFKLRDWDTGQISVLQSSGLDRNYIINGGFWFAQRQAPGTLTTYNSSTARLFGADRWGMVNSVASLQYQRMDTLGAVESGLVSRNYGRFKQITSPGKFAISQVIEGVSSASLRGDTVRVQCKMRRTVATSMTVRLGLIQLTAAGTIDTIPGTFMSAFGAAGTDPTLGTNLSYITPISGTADGGTISGSGLSCVLGPSWVRYSAAFTAPIDAKNLIPCVWTNDLPAANDELNISEFGLYDSPDIHDWVELPLNTELASCQRYCAKTFGVDTAPAQNAGLVGAIRSHVTVAGAVATSSRAMMWRYPVTMRAIPTTITFYNPSAANAFTRNVTGSTDSTATAAVNTSDAALHVNSTGIAAWVVNDEIDVHCLVSAEI